MRNHTVIEWRMVHVSSQKLDRWDSVPALLLEHPTRGIRKPAVSWACTIVAIRAVASYALCPPFLRVIFFREARISKPLIDPNPCARSAPEHPLAVFSSALAHPHTECAQMLGGHSIRDHVAHCPRKPVRSFEGVHRKKETPS